MAVADKFPNFTIDLFGNFPLCAKIYHNTVVQQDDIICDILNIRYDMSCKNYDPVAAERRNNIAKTSQNGGEIL